MAAGHAMDRLDAHLGGERGHLAPRALVEPDDRRPEVVAVGVEKGEGLALIGDRDRFEPARVDLIRQPAQRRRRRRPPVGRGLSAPEIGWRGSDALATAPFVPGLGGSTRDDPIDAAVAVATVTYRVVREL
jgi:hypothetical protein